ncbi:MAG TPA: carbohydrate binding family 9 domain-containing protein, partial [Thermoanaerobaculia bacterium]|nr:carbohydrate binding family 9 domain-containing protein [Thermoanaerobaculia bacterium]
MQAVRVESPPQIDGDVLNDAAWAQATPAAEFWQTRPYAGEPASEHTDVRVTFDATTLYVGVVCYDREPDHLVVSDARRDAPLDDTDSFQMIFDAFRDQQNGFVFGTNPAGIEYDGQLQNDPTGSTFGGGGGGRFGGGSGGGFNVNWDGAWTVAAKTGDYGWSAEFAIPFATLRYPQDEGAVWGLNFQRNIRRRNEVAFWSKLEQQWSLFRLANAGTL